MILLTNQWISNGKHILHYIFNKAHCYITVFWEIRMENAVLFWLFVPTKIQLSGNIIKSKKVKQAETKQTKVLKKYFSNIPDNGVRLIALTKDISFCEC